jgi:hypothetical protein
MQNSAATSIVKILLLLNRLADRVIWVMVRKLGEFPKFLLSTPEQNPLEIVLFSLFIYYFLLVYRISYLLYLRLIGGCDIVMSAFQMEPNDYPHFYLTEDGRLYSMACIARGS